MNRLRIVVEETGPYAYEVVYCGMDRAAADEALHEKTSRNRALYVKPSVSAYNRPTITPDHPKRTGGGYASTQRPPADEPVKVTHTIFKPEPHTEKVEIKHKKK